MKFYLLDDDTNIINILKLIITHENFGEICGMSTYPEDALDDIEDLKPDIVITDLLMPEIDGISVVKKIKKVLPDTAFIMLSQVSAKEMISEAYEAGIEFFIQKPLNSVEVIKVIGNVIASLNASRTISKMQSIFSEELGNASATTIKEDETSKHEEKFSYLRTILQRLGIIGDLGSKDIIQVVEYLIANPDDCSLTLNDLCLKFTDSPKSMEQRIRRTCANGLSNIASLGLNDFGNEIFEEYSNTLFSFEQVRKEMDYISKKSKVHGNVKIKSFIIGLLNHCF